MEIFENETLSIEGAYGATGDPIARIITKTISIPSLTLAEASNLVFGLKVWMKVEYTKKMVAGEGSYNTAFKVR